MSDASQEIVDACLALGFARAGICAAAAISRPEALRAWLRDGRHGSMAWLEAWIEQRVDVGRLLEVDGPTKFAGARDLTVRSLIVVSDQYAERGAADEAAGNADEPVGRIARYARGRDYHEVIRRRLRILCDRLRARHPGEVFRSFVDTAPVMEREHAARAGLGFIGKHTLLIDPARGSWLLLGGIATTLALTPTAEEGRAAGSGNDEVASHCGECTRCIDACPTGAIEPYRVDATRCVSYLTIEHEGEIDPSLHAGMGSWIFGCDVCQEVCPFNQSAAGRGGSAGERARVHPLYREREGLVRGGLRLAEVLGWTAAERRVQLTVSAGKRASLEMLRRNAVIAAGNSDDAGLRARVASIAADADEATLVRETACVVSGRPG